MHEYIYVYTSVYRVVTFLFICYTFTCAYIHIYIYIYIQIYINVYTHIHVFMYIYMHVLCKNSAIETISKNEELTLSLVCKIIVEVQPTPLKIGELQKLT